MSTRAICLPSGKSKKVRALRQGGQVRMVSTCLGATTGAWRPMSWGCSKASSPGTSHGRKQVSPEPHIRRWLATQTVATSSIGFSLGLSGQQVSSMPTICQRTFGSRVGRMRSGSRACSTSRRLLRCLPSRGSSSYLMMVAGSAALPVQASSFFIIFSFIVRALSLAVSGYGWCRHFNDFPLMFSCCALQSISID